MKHHAGLVLSIAVGAAALLVPQLSMAAKSAHARARDWNTAGMRVAETMVPAQADLSTDLVADKIHVGETFHATLSDKVYLKNGPVLPRGTELVGQIVNDDMNLNGASKLALRFTKADLKGGVTIPIKATIVSFDQNPEEPGNGYVNLWTDQMLQVDQIGALKGVDLHSRISGANSGVFVSTTNDHMKLSKGSELDLAIAERQS